METGSTRSETSAPRASAGRQSQLRRCRLIANLTQQQLADRSGGVARRTICRIETGRQRPSLEMATKSAVDGLGLDIRVVFPEAGLTFAEQNERTAGLTGPEKLAAYRALPEREQDEISRNIRASDEAARALKGEG